VQRKHKKQPQKFATAKRTIKLQNPGLVDFYDIQPQNGARLVLTPAKRTSVQSEPAQINSSSLNH